MRASRSAKIPVSTYVVSRSFSFPTEVDCCRQSRIRHDVERFFGLIRVSLPRDANNPSQASENRLSLKIERRLFPVQSRQYLP